MSKIRLPIFNVEQMLKGYARLREAYSRFCVHSIADEAFSPNEMNVLIFLSNNPSINTAKELTVTLGVSKGLVCRSVDTLMRRGYLTSEEDAKDHRILHLRLTQKAAPVIGQMRVNQTRFSEAVTRNISEEELAVYTRVQHQIYANIEAMTNRKGDELCFNRKKPI